MRTREHLVETQYIDGVYDSNGNEIMRPLNEMEKQWLNQFYAETVHADYSDHNSLKKLRVEKKKLLDDSEVLELKQTMKSSSNLDEIKELKKTVTKLRKKNREANKERVDSIEKEYEEIKKLTTLTYAQKSEIYRENRERNNDLYTRAKVDGSLISVSNEEYDIFVADKLQGIDGELLLLENYFNKSKK